jgi:hypothetical protein
VKATQTRRRANSIVLQGDGTALIRTSQPALGAIDVVIDASDVDMLAVYYWRVFEVNGGHRYAYAKPRGKQGSRISLHSLLCDGPLVDHINGDTLDNRRANLRPATATQNNANRASRGGASKYKGVWASRGIARPWAASIGHNNKILRLGRFATEEEAARAYDRAARELWGEYACLNFPAPGQRGAVRADAA